MTHTSEQGLSPSRHKRSQAFDTELGQLGMSRDPETLQINPGGLDELGFPSQLPMAHVAPSIQFLSEKQVAARNAALMRGAFGRLGAGLNLLSSYRPGGAAALTSGLYQAQAQTLANSRTIAPDLMFFYRKRLRTSAEDSAKTAALIAGGIQAATTVAGAAAGVPPVAAAAPAATAPAGGAPAAPTEVQAPSPFQGGGVGLGQAPYAPIASTLLPDQPIGQPVAAADGAPTAPTGGPQPAAGGVGADQAAAGASLIGSGMAGTQAMTAQLAADVGPTMAADILGSTKMDDDPEDRGGAFFDMMTAMLDNMAQQTLSRVFAPVG